MIPALKQDSQQQIPAIATCDGCGEQMRGVSGYWSRSGKYVLCGSRCPGTALRMERSAFEYMKAWVRTQEPSW